MKTIIRVCSIAIISLTCSQSFAGCVTYDNNSESWENNCPYSAFVNFKTTSGGCPSGLDSKGTAGPIKPHDREYDPVIAKCSKVFSWCDYQKWVNGSCRMTQY